MASIRSRLQRVAVGAAMILAVGVAPATLTGAAGPTVSSPPVADQSLGPVADWGTVTGTDGRVYMADVNGRALQFHGFNDKTDDPSGSLTDGLLAAAAERGLDHVRLSIYWQYLEPTEGNFDEAYLDDVVTAIRRAAQHGIRVVLDMHQDVYGQAFGSTGAPTWATETDGLPFTPQPSWLLDYLQPGVQRAFNNLYEKPNLRQAQIDVWVHVVQRVKNEPGVLGYDLMNEPFGEIQPGENLITAAARVEREQITPMYQRLTDAISAVDPAHWIFIEPPNLASLGIATSMGAVHGPKVAFYPHMYDTSLESSTYDPSSPQYTYDPQFFTKWATAITTYVATNPMPMLVGEWGIAKPEANSMGSFVRQTLATLDATTSGWSQFMFCFGSNYCPVDASGHDRPNIGQMFEPYARAIAGAPTASTFDFTTRELKVVYRDNSSRGTTDIFVPESRSYPSGFQVFVDGASSTNPNGFDASTGVLSVTVPKSGGSHAICVVPVGMTPTDCTANTPGPAGPTAPAAPVATPVAVRPTYTG
ncbi:MAG: cellulase family glycosylhydrolase [Actinobacteria bacterium]|nr:cellulase family glycosylhydrolase [Actinomycetota bacterium]